MKIALVPMAAKPYHAGHDGLVRIAASENDLVKLFVSTSDRKRPGEIPILGSDMMTIWTSYIEPTLPGNVEVEYVNVPVTGVYSALESADASKSKDEFYIYSDSEDILKYRESSLKKSAPRLFKANKINLKGVDRTQTVPVSGTKMRQLLSTGNVKKFVSLLPPAVRQYGTEIYDILSKQVVESLIRDYTKLILRG